MGQTHDKHREPERKIVTTKNRLSLIPCQIEPATPPAQLSLVTGSISTCLFFRPTRLGNARHNHRATKKDRQSIICCIETFFHPYSGTLDIRVKAALASALPLRARKSIANERIWVSLPSPNSISACNLAKIWLALLLGFPAKNSLCALRLKTNGAASNARAVTSFAVWRTGVLHILCSHPHIPAETQATCS